jgi:hypothetical protein
MITVLLAFVHRLLYCWSLCIAYCIAGVCPSPTVLLEFVHRLLYCWSLCIAYCIAGVCASPPVFPAEPTVSKTAYVAVPCYAVTRRIKHKNAVILHVLMLTLGPFRIASVLESIIAGRLARWLCLYGDEITAASTS